MTAAQISFEKIVQCLISRSIQIFKESDIERPRLGVPQVARKITEENIVMIFELRDAGYSYEKISKKVGVSPTHVLTIHKHGSVEEALQKIKVKK